MENGQELRLTMSGLTSGETTHSPGGHPMEIWISYVLRVGVLIAAAIIALGLLLLFVQGPGPGDPTSLHDLQARGGRAIGVDFLSLLRSALKGRASSVIQIGVLALILTPIARVAMTAVLFVAQRDRIFTAITLVVLAILVLGLIGIGA